MNSWRRPARIDGYGNQPCRSNSENSSPISRTNPGRTMPPSSDLRGVQHGDRSVGSVDGDGTSFGIKLPDQPHSGCEIFASFAFHLRPVFDSLSTSMTRSGQGRDRLLGNPAFGETVPGGKRDIGNPNEARKEPHVPSAPETSPRFRGLDEIRAEFGSMHTRRAIRDIPSLSPPALRRPVRRGGCNAVRLRDVGLGRRAGRGCREDPRKRNAAEPSNEVVQRGWLGDRSRRRAGGRGRHRNRSSRTHLSASARCEPHGT